MGARRIGGWGFPAVVLGVVLSGATIAWATGTAGSPDPTFGGGGIVTINAAGYANEVVVQADGRVVVGGNPTNHWSIRRFNTDGSPDLGYGSGGEVTLFGGATGSYALSDMALDASGRVLAVGGLSTTVTTYSGKKATTTTANLATIARVDSNGSPDTTFGSGGKVTLFIPNAKSSAGMAVAEQPDGKILIAGHASLPSGRSSFQSARFVARCYANGSVDSTFGTNGVVVHDVTASDDDVYPGFIALQSGGEILVGGIRGRTGWSMTRYSSSGSVDTTFGPVESTSQFMRGIAVDGSNRIVVIGDITNSTGGDTVAARYQPNGDVDPWFGSGGTTVIPMGARSYGYAGVAIDADGKLIFSAQNFPNWPTSNAAQTVTLRLDAAGALDTSFGFGGITAPIAVGPNNIPAGVALAPDGRIVVCGRFTSDVVGGAMGWFLARYDAN